VGDSLIREAGEGHRDKACRLREVFGSSREKSATTVLAGRARL